MFIFQVKSYDKDISIKFINGLQSIQLKKNFTPKMKEKNCFFKLFKCTMIQNIKMNIQIK